MLTWANKFIEKIGKKNIHAHYDLGNKFYEEWLDDTLTYSSGYYKTGEETLTQAQENKFDSLIKGNEESVRSLADELVKKGKTVHIIGGADVASELDAKRAVDQGVRLAISL